MPDFAVRTAFTATDRVSPAFSRMQKAANATRTAMAALLPMFGVALIANYANKAIELASALTEVQNVVDTTFGKNSEAINQWSKNAIEKFGLSELQAKQFTGTIGAMAKGVGVSEDKLVGMSTGLAGLAGDFASFYNLPIEEAFNKIRAGLSGETEPLKQIGKDMSVAGLEAFRMAQGIQKSVDKMSMAEKYQLRYAYLMSQSKDQIGDFNKTLMTSYANQKRVLGVQFDQALARLAVGILPSLTAGFRSLNEVFKNTDWEMVGKAVTVLLKLIPPLLTGLLAWKLAIMAMKVPMMINTALIWGAQAALWVFQVATIAASVGAWIMNGAMYALAVAFAIGLWPILAIIAAVGLLITAGVLLYKNWDTVTEFFSGAWETVKEKFTLACTVIWDAMKSLGRGIMTVLLAPTNLMISGIIKLLEIASNIPGIGDKFAAAAAKAKGFQADMNASVGATNLLAPNQAAANLQGGGTTVNINSNGTEAKAEVTPRQGAKVNMNKLGYQQ